MRKQIKVISLLLMVVWLASFAVAMEKPAVQQAGAGDELVIGGQDVITASDAGGGYLSTRDIVLIVVVILAVIGLAAIL